MVKICLYLNDTININTYPILASVNLLMKIFVVFSLLPESP